MALKFRRGTTAQQSGSLAYGEPYVNTDLGTLLVGGASGDIQLSNAGPTSTFAGASVSASTFVSASSLKVTGNASVDGDLTLGGKLTIGDNTSDTVNVVASLSSSLIPQTSNIFDLGSETKFWRDLYISTGSIKMINPATNQVVTTINAVSGGIQIGSVQITTSSISFVDNNGNITQNIAQSSSVGSTSNFATTGSNVFTGRQYVTGGINVYAVSEPDIRFGNGTTNIGYHIQNSDNGTFEIHNTTTGRTLFQFQSASLANGHQNASFFGGLSVSQSILALGFTGSIAANNGVVSGSSQLPTLATTGSNTFNGNQTINGLVQASGSSGYHTFTGASRFIDGQVSFENNTTVVYGALSFLNPSQNAGLTLQNIGASGSNKLILAVQELEILGDTTLSGSFTLNGFPLVNTNQLSSLNSATASYARKDSANVFNGNQTITGSLFVTQDLVVQGSSSIQNISSSTLNIGTNLVTVAVNNPSVRFGGIAVIDSGSAGGSGSFLYDSVQDEFIFVHRGNGTNTTSSVFLMGPQTIDNLGNETYLTNNRVPKGGGLEHLNDSNITDDGTLITLGSNTVVTGTLVASGTALVSSSAQITAGSTTNFATDVKTQLNSNTVVSGSAQITAASTTGFATGVKTQLDTNTVVSGSGQINVASTTGDIALGTRTSGNYVASLVAGTNITLSNNSGEGATPSIGLTNNTISGVSLGGNLATLTIGTGLSGTSYNGSSLVTIANTGVLSNVAGTGVTVSGATGNVTISIGQSVATNATPTFGNLTINGTITATGDITAFFTSDRRHKNNIQTIPNALEKVSKLNGVTWEWNDDVNEVTKSTPKTGLIAQEVQQVLPQVVIERENGFLALDYSKMVGLLVEAIKEQQIQIDQLKAQIGSK